VSFYRLYFRDREGHIGGLIELEARDDAQAVRMADRMGRRQKRELWRDNSLLKRWDGRRRLTFASKDGSQSA
jgi:hypothetical protein